MVIAFVAVNVVAIIMWDYVMSSKRRKFVISFLNFSIIALMMVISFQMVGNISFVALENVKYSTVLDNQNSPLIEDGQSTQKIRYADIMYSGAIASLTNHVILNDKGLLANISAIQGIQSINVVFEVEQNA